MEQMDDSVMGKKATSAGTRVRVLRQEVNEVKGVHNTGTEYLPQTIRISGHRDLSEAARVFVAWMRHFSA